MLLGLLSDTHDNEERTRRAVAVLEDRDVDAVLHAGDVTSPQLLASALEGRRAWVALGNMDRDRKGLRRAGEELAPPVAVDDVHEIQAGAAQVGLIHGDDRGRLEGMVQSGAFDLVVHGHTHEFRDERVGSTRVVNPGAIHRTSDPLVCTYETEGDKLERIPLEAGT